ncbi:MAG: phosphotransferase [Planctomycetota bacterium]
MSKLTERICKLTSADSVELGDVIQELWSGYGVIQRAVLHRAEPIRVVIKRIDLSEMRENRRGWASDVSHQRKVRSYQIEQRFYASFAGRCDATCRVPAFIAADADEDGSGSLMVLEDVDDAGFEVRKQDVVPTDMSACLAWLANFHATFMSCEAEGLWPVGTYWHLETRPDEFAAMADGPLKRSARQIDQRLNQARFQTLVHGDAKVANFCFSRGATVAAVDFQYVGLGCGMKDVAYFISSCLNEREAADRQDSLLAEYFQQLQAALARRQAAINFEMLEDEWRALYPFAWADFCRFLSGWSPGHWKLNGYSERVTQSVLATLRHS